MLWPMPRATEASGHKYVELDKWHLMQTSLKKKSVLWQGSLESSGVIMPTQEFIFRAENN